MLNKLHTMAVLVITMGKRAVGIRRMLNNEMDTKARLASNTLLESINTNVAKLARDT